MKPGGLRGDLRVPHANDSFHEVFHTTHKDVESKVIYELKEGSCDFADVAGRRAAEEESRERYSIDHDFGAGRKQLIINARQLHQRSKGTQLSLIALSEVSGLLEKDPQ